MNTNSEVRDFLSQKTLAIVGLSRDPKAFSASVFRDLSAKGYRLLPVNPNAASIGGVACHPDIASLPEAVGGALILTPPAQTEAVLRQAIEHGITRVWIQQGAGTPAAEKLCLERGLSAVSGKCILMFAQPVASMHGLHRWFAKLFGRLPRD
jgi:predicted CoA-binding protein